MECVCKSESRFGLSLQTKFVTEICSELGCGVVDSVGGHTRCLRGRICLELQDRDIPSESEKVVEKGVPLHPPPLQGSDISALLMITFEKGWCRSLQTECGKGLRGDSDETPRHTPVCERRLLVPRNYVQFHTLPI